jgi:hypothetical protein
MGNFNGVSSFYRHIITKSKVKVDYRFASTDECKNYRVYYNSSEIIHSSLLTTIHNRRHQAGQVNRIRTTRYNILTFLPKNLFQQFRRFANVYFAILIGLNWVPIINAVSKTVFD